MKRFIRHWILLSLAVCLVACGTLPAGSQERDYLPGGVAFYSAGSVQNKEYFLKYVKRAQSEYSLYTKQRHWIDDGPTPAPSALNMLQVYYPLSVRWELKDGRQFIAEKIDVRAIMREYFKANDIQLQWQREGRARAAGDYDPSFVYEVHEEEVIVKWLLRYNHTPLERRATELPKTEYLQYRVAAVKGTPTSGIDFSKQWEFLK